MLIVRWIIEKKKKMKINWKKKWKRGTTHLSTEEDCSLILSCAVIIIIKKKISLFKKYKIDRFNISLVNNNIRLNGTVFFLSWFTS